MLAHVNPEEAALLKARGGSGTINPQTGLPEFYHHFEKGMGAYGMLPQKYPQIQINAMSMPVLAQALGADEFKNIPNRLKTTEVPPEWIGMGSTRPGYSKVNPEYGQYARFGEYTGMGQGGELVNYEIPTDKTFQGKPLVAIYDPQGNFKHITLSPESYLTPDPNQPNIIAQPKFNLSGGIVDYGVGDTSANKGGFGEMIGGMVSDLSPIILAALGANFATGNLGGLLGGGASTAGAGAAAGGAGVPGGLFGSTLPAGAGAGGFFAPGVTAGAATLGIPTMTGAPAGVTAGIPSGAAAPAASAAAAPAASAAAAPAAASTIPAAAAAAPAAATIPGAATTGFPTTAAGLLDFAAKNPSLVGGAIGAITGAVGAANAPKSTTTTASIDPELKAEYLANIARAKETAAGLGVRQFEGFTDDYLRAQDQVTNLGLSGKGQQTTDEAARLAMIEAGFTPQQIQAAQSNRQNIQNTSGQLGSQYMSAYQNPFEEQVVQGALGDIERTRQIQEQANRAQATSARAFGGSRQGVVSGMTNEAALRQAASTSGQLRQAGFNTAAQLGQSDAARALQAQMANQGVDMTIEQANAQLRQQAALANQGAFAQGAGIRQAAIGQLGQLGAQQQNLGLTGANAVMEAQMRQQALRQARLDAERNLGIERLGITSGSLGIGIPNLGGSTSQPLYSSTAGGALSGGLTGGYIGSLLGERPSTKPYKPGDFIQGP